MTEAHPCSRILVLAGDVSRHIGDGMIQHALVEQIRSAFPQADICCAASARSRPGPALPGARWEAPPPALLMRPGRVRKFDAVVWGGGQLLQDDASLLKNPYWALVLSGVRGLTRGPLVGCGIGIGPLDTGWGRFFARRALLQLDALVVRDSTSERLARELLRGRGPEVHRAPDPAAAGSVADPGEGERYLREMEGVPAPAGDIRLGIAVQPFHVSGRRLRPAQWLAARTESSRPAEPPARLAHLVQAVNRFAAARPTRCLFFPLYNAPWERDDLESARWAESLSAPSHVLRMDADPAVLRAAAGRCDLFLSLRLHGSVLSMSAGVPTAGIACARKVVDFYGDMGQSAYCMTEADLIAPGGGARLADMLEQLWQARADSAVQLRTAFGGLRTACAEYARTLQSASRGPRRKAGGPRA